jgi:predicted amidophosphoribosyltransferase
MRHRHFPRVCRVCHAPMARQEDSCWRCGTPWTSEDAPQITSHPMPAAAPVAVPREKAA